MRLALLAIAVLCACAKGSATQADSNTGGGKGDGTGSGDASVDAKSIDASNGCAVQPCSIEPQCGCTDPGHPACDLGSGSSNACRFATPAGVEGHTCTAPTECAAQYTCVGGGGNFSCEKYCTSNTDCIAPRGQCVIQLTDGTNPIPGAVVCSSNCDPASTTNALCPSGWTCDLFSATYMTVDHSIADCRLAGSAGNGAACSTTVACAAGYSCVNTGSDVCKKICNKTMNTGCTSGSCMSFTTPVTIGGTEYGVCL
jgi:hypothetical protein